MLRSQVPFFKAAAIIMLCVAAICSSLQAEDDLLNNPSIHIMVNDNQEIPESGAFKFDIKIFKVEHSMKAKIADFDARLTKELSAHFNEKKFTEASDSPDLLINYAVAANQPITEADFKYAYKADSEFELPKFEQGKEIHYNHGALIIDIVDAKSKKLLWRGAIMAEFKKDVSQKVKDRRLKHAVKHLMAHFPKPQMKK